MQKGIVHLTAILIGIVALAAIALTVGSVVTKKDSQQEVSVEETVTPEATQSPTPEPTATPTPTPEPTVAPTVAPTKAATPAPAAVSGSAPSSSGYNWFTVATERGTFSFHLVTINMAGVRMLTDTANDDDCGDGCNVLSLGDFVSRNGGFAGINGSYFCPASYDSCAGKTNSFDFPVYNSRLGKWINGGNLFWNNRSIIYSDGGGVHFLRNANSFGGGLSAGVVNHPGVLENGNVIADQFGLEPKQIAKGTKSGIGIRGNVVYLVVASGVDALDLGHIFKALGASDALNLDGGGSSALWFGGYKAGPGRNIPNAIIFAN